ncbi:MAG: spiro-SPASM protein, partial [Spirochaetota bacterium]
MVVCLYNTAPRAYLAEPLDGRDTVRRMLDYVRGLSTLTNDDESLRILLYSTEEVDHPADWEYRGGPALTQARLTELLAELSPQAEEEPILFGFLDEPFLNLELTARMLDRHRKYRAEYTFSDGYPAGLGPELLSSGAIGHLRALASETERVGRDGVFPIVAKDINRLDVETELSRVDQRLLRLQLAVDTRPNLVLCKRLAEGAPVAIDEWPAHAAAHRSGHRTLPRFVSIQVLEQEIQRLSYSPYPTMRGDVLAPGALMTGEQFGELISAVAAFSPEAMVHLSLWGEIALHPEIEALIDTVLATEGLRLLVETSGVGW